MSAISLEIAKSDIDKWLDYKRINSNKREDYKVFIDNLIAAIQDGCLVLDDEMKLKYELLFPIGENGAITHITFSPRLLIEKKNAALKGVAPSDADGRLSAIIQALTSQSKGVINQMDTEDFAVCQSIAVFFT